MVAVLTPWGLTAAQHRTLHLIQAACSFRKLSKHLLFSRLAPLAISWILPQFSYDLVAFLSPLQLRAEVVNFRDKPTNRKLLTPSSPASLFVARSAERSRFCEQIWSWNFWRLSHKSLPAQRCSTSFSEECDSSDSLSQPIFQRKKKKKKEETIK